MKNSNKTGKSRNGNNNNNNGNNNMKKGNNNNNNNILENINNNLNLRIEKVPQELDILAIVFIIILIAILVSKHNIPEESKLAFLLALILLISCYNIEIGIVVVVIAIIYVLVQNNIKKNKEQELLN